MTAENMLTILVRSDRLKLLKGITSLRCLKYRIDVTLRKRQGRFRQPRAQRPNYLSSLEKLRTLEQMVLTIQPQLTKGAILIFEGEVAQSSATRTTKSWNWFRTLKSKPSTELQPKSRLEEKKGLHDNITIQHRMYSRKLST